MPFKRKLWVIAVWFGICNIPGLVTSFEHVSFATQDIPCILAYQLYQVTNTRDLSIIKVLMGITPCSLVSIILSFVMMNDGQLDSLCMISRYRTRSRLIGERLLTGLITIFVFTFLYIGTLLLTYSTTVFGIMQRNNMMSLLLCGVLWSLYSFEIMLICMNVNLRFGEVLSVVVWFILLIAEGMMSYAAPWLSNRFGISKCVVNLCLYDKIPVLLFLLLAGIIFITSMLLFWQVTGKDFGIDGWRSKKRFGNQEYQ